MMKIAGLLIGAAVGIAPLQATPQSKDYVQVFNYPAADSCGRWLKDRANGDRAWQGNEGWVLGFVTGHNLYSNKPLTGMRTNGEGLLAWVDNYCRQNPLDTVTTAASKLVSELETKGY